ncbi:DUF2634 domain-containing protein [Lentilactobacillus sp. Marseille-Q4993]|uniref:DUF2634 domain-containing protein n=1 Tax=Lentilactobacillus sp. Marseille-Q4993 TaxID=3039492 RepID=UPI0024BCD03D|nr:DUF2634 domain-containing protein [Lentilactobacillus sp. Marseille-Q4993]
MNNDEIEEIEDESLEDEVDADVDEVEEETLPTLTFRVRNGRIVDMCDELEAMVQAVDKILKTERFVYPIYDDQYGNDLPELFGKDFDYAKVEVERMIVEALAADDRVNDVTISKIEQTDSTSLLVEGDCITVYGTVPFDSEVSLTDES